MIGGSESPVDVLVVGAGISGLIAARRLSAEGRSVVVVDKGRGVGGRMATRRIGDGVFDHGAQFFTTPGPELTALVAEWAEAGAVEPWFRGRLEPDGTLTADGHVRWRGRTGMTDVAKHLAVDLDVRTGHRVVAVSVGPDGSSPRWVVENENGQVLTASGLVLTAPVPQSLALLEAGGTNLAAAERRDLSALRYHRCLAVLAELDGPCGLPEPGAWRVGGEPVEFVADNQAKGLSSVPALTVHAGAVTSLELWDRDDDEVVRVLLAAVPGLMAGPRAGRVQVQRWRYARPVSCRPERARMLRDVPPAVMAGDIFGGPLVGGAARSGVAAAELLSATLGPHHSP